ncbi:MAG: TetR/AcrR family transcriptional regulator [Desulfobacteraceae bacterium]|nr:MAG: TetR/AcrR family transcriptional regulator [Desulfobacteraceae bacterium]
MSKGEETKNAILTLGLEMASLVGLENVSIGSLAKAAAMSKSGLFAHFQSKENLQVEILAFAGELFSQGVIIPALRTPAGIPRIKSLTEHWVKWNADLTGGCIFVTASSDFKDRPGKVRDFLLHQQEQWLDCLRRIALSAIKSGDFRADIDCDQFAFEFYSLLLGFHLYHKLLARPDIQTRQEQALVKLLTDYQTASKPDHAN